MAARPPVPLDAGRRSPHRRFLHWEFLHWERPSGRSLAVGFAIALAAAAAYAAALETSIFAVRTIRVEGGSPSTQAEVRRALADDIGVSLVRVHAAEVAASAEALPDVVSVSVDRAFPHTLVVRVTPERADLVLHQGKTAWLVSSRGRVLRKLRRPALSRLPRTWVPSNTPIAAGRTLTAVDGGLAAAALAPLAGAPLPIGIRIVRASTTELTLVSGSHFELRLGSIADLRLKLAVARRILRLVGAGAASSGYLDVSVPQRPVLSSANTQVSSGGLP